MNKNINNEEKLAICFHPWMVFEENDNFDESIKEMVERGFNCIRIDDGAGLLWDEDGNVRDDVLISQPFGKYTKYTTSKGIADGKRMNILERLLKICKAAKAQNVRVILSSWFFLHTNWYCEEKDKKHLFDLTTEEKMSFFANELSKILNVLRKEELIDIIAFVEIFNEFDGLPFAGEYRGIADDKARELRALHEKEIDKLKKAHPDILFAFDTWTPRVNPEIIPRNIDVLDFHHYYAWSVYDAFQQDIVCRSLEEIVIPEDTRYYLKDELVSVADIVKEMGVLRTGVDWPSRISLYASIDKNKEDELTALLENELKNNFERYIQKLHAGIDAITETHRKVAPHSKIVMGEGATYCASPTLTFERDSKHFWEMIYMQMSYFNEKDFWGSVITTTHAPGKSAAWDACKDMYLKANKLFLNKDQA